jgi:hypothetical protein
MKTLNFNDNQCVLIENREQYEQVYHYMASAKRYNSLSEWEGTHGYLSENKFPFYLSYANSVTRGSFISRVYEPKNIWNNQPYEVLTFEQATKQ